MHLEEGVVVCEHEVELRVVVAKMVLVHRIGTATLEHSRAFLTHGQARQDEKSHIRRKMF